MRRRLQTAWAYACSPRTGVRMLPFNSCSSHRTTEYFSLLTSHDGVLFAIDAGRGIGDNGDRLLLTS